MKIEAVIVCVNYSDFLAHTLPYNKNHFNRLVVVTDTKDIKTKKLCDFYNVQCIQTEAFYEDGAIINKGKGINEGLKALDLDGWVIHLDADIYLPTLTRSILENIELDGQTLYGIDRMMCPNYESWLNFIDSPSPMHEGWIYVHTTAFPLGTRIAEYKGKGWEPIGFFQMWNPKDSGVFEYPKHHGGVDRSDVIFAKYFSRAKRQLIPEIIAIHLESEYSEKMGSNWNGRKTPPFGLNFLINTLKQELPIVDRESDYTVDLNEVFYYTGMAIALFTLLFA